MRKKISVSGFLLTEFIIAFALISFVIVCFSQSIYFSIHEYQQAKESIAALDVACNAIEEMWIGESHFHSELIVDDYTINFEAIPIIMQDVLPNMPKCAQQIMDVAWQDRNKMKKVSICCGITKK